LCRPVYSQIVKRALVMFPKSDNLGQIEDIRAQYDPHARYIAAHVTLVFPFADDVSDEGLRAHVSAATRTMAPFTARFENPRDFDDGYIALEATTGRRELIDLHDRLYSGPLARHLSAVHTYRPHVTLAKVDDPRMRPRILEAIRQQTPVIETTLHAVTIFTIA
jgi:2'-5' RNA ligase